MTDIHRFWEQTGSFYARGMGNDNLADPFIGLGSCRASSALFRDMTGIRFEHPEWIPENCTACGDCYTVCPDTAIPGLVNEVGQVLDTVVNRSSRTATAPSRAPAKGRALMERHLRRLVQGGEGNRFGGALMDQAIEQTLPRASSKDAKKSSSTKSSTSSGKSSADSSSR